MTFGKRLITGEIVHRWRKTMLLFAVASSPACLRPGSLARGGFWRRRVSRWRWWLSRRRWWLPRRAEASTGRRHHGEIWGGGFRSAAIGGADFQRSYRGKRFSMAASIRISAIGDFRSAACSRLAWAGLRALRRTMTTASGMTPGYGYDDSYYDGGCYIVRHVCTPATAGVSGRSTVAVDASALDE